MQTKPYDAKSKNVVVATVEVEVFDTVAEAIEFFGGEEAVLEMLNGAHKTSSLNEARQRATGTGKASKKNIEEFLQVCSDEDFHAYRELLQKRNTNEASDQDISDFIRDKLNQ